MPRARHNRDASRPGYCQCGNPEPCPVYQRAQAAAERIAREHLGDRPALVYDWRILYRDAAKPPTDIGTIREALLAGYAWTSWMEDPRIADDLRLMHGPPASGDYG